MKLDTLLSRVHGHVVTAGPPVPLKQDASSRSYYRVTVDGGDPPTVVVMQMGVDPRASDVHTDCTRYDEVPFLNVQRFLARGGIPVPRVLAVDDEQRLIALEDLGDATLERVLNEAPVERWSTWYARAVDLLVAFQSLGRDPDPRCQAFSRAFDVRQLRWELDHFTEWGLEARGVTPTPAQRGALDRCFDTIACELASAGRFLVHRDFQSRNLMVQGEALRVIDFQDALLGPRAFDLVCLLCDSYIDVGPDLQRAMLDRYAALTRLDPGGRDALTRQFRLQTVQRKLKDAGRFVFIQRVKGNDSFLPYLEPSLVYVRRALADLPELAELEAVLMDLAPPDGA